MLGVLRRHYRDDFHPEFVANAPLAELWDIPGFGAAATYECRDWLTELGLWHPEINDWVRERDGAGMGDPRVTREPSDYSYDAQHERMLYT